MENQSQGLLRGAIIAGAAAGAVIFLLNGRSSPAPAASAVSDAVDSVGSSELGRRGTRIVELLLATVSDTALADARTTLKDILQRLEDLVDEI